MTGAANSADFSGPAWLSDWRAAPIGAAEALGRFDALDGLGPAEMLGRWRGAELATGHPLDGLLAALGWWGKDFASTDRVDPLLFTDRQGGPVALDPARMPVGFALRHPDLARSAAARMAFAALRPLLRTRRPAARLRTVQFRGKASAAMVYDLQPVIDHFRRIAGGLVLGLMEMRDVPPSFFLLVRTDGGGGQSPLAPSGRSRYSQA